MREGKELISPRVCSNSSCALIQESVEISPKSVETIDKSVETIDKSVETINKSVETINQDEVVFMADESCRKTAESVKVLRKLAETPFERLVRTEGSYFSLSGLHVSAEIEHSEYQKIQVEDIEIRKDNKNFSETEDIFKGVVSVMNLIEDGLDKVKKPRRRRARSLVSDVLSVGLKIPQIFVTPSHDNKVKAHLSVLERIVDEARQEDVLEFCAGAAQRTKSIDGIISRLKLAHDTFGHCDWNVAAKAIGEAIPEGAHLFCRTCAAAKLHRKQRGAKIHEPNPAGRAGEYLHVDLHGKVRHVTQNGVKYFAVVVDDYSRRIFVILCVKKSDFADKFAELLTEIEAETRMPVARVKTDGDGIFRDDSFREMMRKRGTRLALIPPYSSYFNGKAERCIGILKEKARCMLIQSGLPRHFWAEAVVYAAQVLNRSFRNGLPDGAQCALSAWRGVPITDPGKNLHPFGCEVWAIDNKAAPKNASKGLTTQVGVPCVFLGLQSDKGSYRVYSIVHSRVFHTVDVIFDNSSFPIASKRNYAVDYDYLAKNVEIFSDKPEQDELSASRGRLPEASRFEDLEENPSVDVSRKEKGLEGVVEPVFPSGVASRAARVGLDQRAPTRESLERFQFYSVESTNIDPVSAFTQGLDQGLPATQRLKCVLSCMSEDRRTPIFEVLRQLIGEDNGREGGFLYSLESIATSIPKTQREAYMSVEKELWKDAERRHLKTLLDGRAVEIVDLPTGSRAIPTKWVYTRKGKEEPHNARLVVLGFMQREGIDYKETFSPVVSWRIVRFFIAMWTIHDWDVADKIDLKQAFNSTPTDVEFHARMPPGHDVSGKALKVLGSLPGGKASGRNLHLALRKIFISLTCYPILSDMCVYVWKSASGDGELYILVWVDEMFCFSPKNSVRPFIDRMVVELQRHKYQVHRLGDISSGLPKCDVLGVDVKRDRSSRTTTLNLCDYFEKYLKNTKNMHGVSYWDSGLTKPTPCDSHAPILSKTMNASNDSEKALASSYHYLSRVMTLMYPALIVRPDLLNTVSVAARFVENPGPAHLLWMDHLSYYINGTRNLKLVFHGRSEHPRFHIFTDSSWVDEPDTRATSMGRAVFLGSCLIDWKAGLIRRVMTSTNHGEFFAQNEAAKDSEFWRQFCEELGFPSLAERNEILGDNEKALMFGEGKVMATKCKHYDLLLFYQRELFELNRLFYTFVRTHLNLADIFTKGKFTADHFCNLRSQLMGYAPIQALIINLRSLSGKIKKRKLFQ